MEGRGWLTKLVITYPVILPKMEGPQTAVEAQQCGILMVDAG